MTTSPRIIIDLNLEALYRFERLERAGFEFRWVQLITISGVDRPYPPVLMVLAPSQGSRVTRIVAQEFDPREALKEAWHWWWCRVWHAHLTSPKSVLGSEYRVLGQSP